MWVYQEPEKNAAARQPVPALTEEQLSGPAEEGSESGEVMVLEPAAAGKEMPGVSEKSGKARRKLPLPSKDCILLAAAYLFGTGMSGVLQALCDTAEKETMAYYIQCWQNVFAASAPAQAVGLFGAELAVVLGAASILLLLGLSAVGPLPIFLFAMLYGTGSGLISMQVFTGLSGMQRALLLLTASLPTALAAGALCLFGASALQVSSRIHAFSFGQGRGTAYNTAGARLLLGQFALLAVSLCPLCGAATGLVCLVNRMLQAG